MCAARTFANSVGIGFASLPGQSGRWHATAKFSVGIGVRFFAVAKICDSASWTATAIYSLVGIASYATCEDHRLGSFWRQEVVFFPYRLLNNFHLKKKLNY